MEIMFTLTTNFNPEVGQDQTKQTCLGLQRYRLWSSAIVGNSLMFSQKRIII